MTALVPVQLPRWMQIEVDWRVSVFLAAIGNFLPAASATPV